ncbi:hypothetical protein ACWEOA_30775, partial [Streptomyces sp. NPDC004457]
GTGPRHPRERGEGPVRDGVVACAQRLAREGLFLLVQGQTVESRAAHLRTLGGAPATAGGQDR